MAMHSALKKWLRQKPAGLEIISELSKGSYGVVYLAKYEKKDVAVKKIHKILFEDPDGQSLVDSFLQECDNMKSISHPNIVGYIGAYYDGSEPLLVMELMHETLANHLSKQKGGMSFERQLVISVSIADGLKCLHNRKQPIIHRDLSSKNILLTADGIVKISDLGQAKLLKNSSQALQTTQPGCVSYMPPEALQSGVLYTALVDAFSLGVLMLEIATGQAPKFNFTGIGSEAEVSRRSVDLEVLDNKHPLKPLIIWCFQLSNTRPDVNTIHGHVFAMLTSERTKVERENWEEIAKEREVHEHQLKAKMEKILTTLDEVQTANGHLTSELAKNKSAVKGLENDIAKKDDEKKRLAYQSDKHQREAMEWEKKHKELHDKHNTTSASLRSLKAEETKLKLRLQAAANDADRKVAPVKAQLLSKEKDLEKEVREKAAKELIIQKHMATITERDDQNSKIRRENQELKRQARERDEEKTMMMRRQENLEERNQGLTTIRTTQQAEINGLEGRCKDLESQVADWKKKDKDMWEMASDCIDRKIEMMSEIEEYREQIDKLVAKNLSLKEEYKKLKIENARLKLYDSEDEYYDAAPDEDSEKTETKSKKSSWGLPMLPAWFSGSSSKQEDAKPDTGSAQLNSSPHSVSKNESTDSGVILGADCSTSSSIGMEEKTDDKKKEDKKAKGDIKSSIGKGKESNNDVTQAQGKPLLSTRMTQAQGKPLLSGLIQQLSPRKLDSFDDPSDAKPPRRTRINSDSTATTFTDTLSSQLPHRGSVVSKPSTPLNVPTPKPRAPKPAGDSSLRRSNSDRKLRSKSHDVTKKTSYGKYHTTKPGDLSSIREHLTPK